MYRRPARELRRSPPRRRPPAPVAAGQPAPPVPATGRPGRRRLVAGLVGVAVVAAGGGIYAALAGGGSSPPPPAPVVEPATYEIVYQVDNLSSGHDQRSWEVLDVTSPLDVSDLTYPSDPRRGARPESGTVSTATALYDLSGGRLVLVSSRAPALGSGAEALGAELAPLVSWGLAAMLGRHQVVAGNDCNLVEMSEPPAGPISPLGAGGHDDICLAADGLELAETWTYHGRVVLRREAVEVRVGSPDPTIAGAPAPASASPAGGPVLVAVGPAGSGSFLPAPSPPPGFSARPAVSVLSYNPEQTGQLVDRATQWTFVAGGGLVTVEAGVGSRPWDDSGYPTRTIRLGRLGSATEALDSEGPQLQVQLSPSEWVVVAGTISLASLARYASSLAGP